MNSLERETINRVDSEMAALFTERMRAAELVAAYKKEHGLPITDAEREAAVIRNSAQQVDDPILREYYVRFIQETMALSRAYQSRLLEGMRVAYSGTEGAFAHIATGKLFPSAEKIGFPDFESAYRAVENGECDAAVLPVENSTNGEVGQVMDLMFSGGLFVNRMLDLPVTQDLLVKPGTAVEEIRTVISHPQALGQCAARIREAGGLCVPAHINRGSSGVLGALGFLPQGVHYDALEVSPAAPLTADVTGYRLLRSSDAHSLEQMLEREFALEAETRSVDAVFDAIAGRTQPD